MLTCNFQLTRNNPHWLCNDYCSLCTPIARLGINLFKVITMKSIIQNLFKKIWFGYREIANLIVRKLIRKDLWTAFIYHFSLFTTDIHRKGMALLLTKREDFNMKIHIEFSVEILINKRIKYPENKLSKNKQLE